jgi:ankyrin repeat protein
MEKYTSIPNIKAMCEDCRDIYDAISIGHKRCTLKYHKLGPKLYAGLTYIFSTKPSQPYTLDGDVHIINSKRICTPLSYAVCKDKSEMVKYLLKLDINCAYLYSEVGYMPIHDVIVWDDMKYLKILMQELKGNVNVRTRDVGKLPMHIAAFSQRLNILTYLVECGGDVREKDYRDKTPIDYAIEMCRYGNIPLENDACYSFLREKLLSEESSRSEE